MNKKEISKTILLILVAIVLVVVTGFVGDGTDEYGDIVTIEYSCSKLGTYETVPNEVIEECKRRTGP